MVSTSNGYRVLFGLCRIIEKYYRKREEYRGGDVLKTVMV
jgi:hypothetical protein